MKKVQTLCVLYDETRVLLAMKKRGFGAGRWNGFGGKVENGEIVQAAALRECQEEGGITPINLIARGVLTFFFAGDPVELEVHLFSASTFSGELRETEEMRPQWFVRDTIPYSEMWPDDRYWLPLFLEGKTLRANFHFQDHDTLLRHTIDVVGG